MIPFIIVALIGILIGSILNVCILKIRYPLIEFVNGILYVLVFYYFGISIVTIAYAMLFTILLMISVIDYYTMRIPNILIIFGMTIGIVYLIILSIYYREITIIFKGIIGMLVGGAIIGGIMVFSLLVFKKEGMGMGDLKLLAMVGLFTGSRYVFYTIFIAVLVGGLYAAIILLKKEQDIFPFGPFLSVGAVVAIPWGDALWYMYMNYMT